MKNIMKIVFTLVIVAGLFLAGRASADTKISIGLSFGHHGGVITYVDLFETHHRHYYNPAMHHHMHGYYDHRRYERKRGHGFRRVQRVHHDDIYYYHRHGIHRYCHH